MEDQVQNPLVQPNLTPDEGQVVQPVQVPMSSSLHKEAGPVSISDREPILHQEVAEAGVEVVPDKPKLDEVHEQIGVRHSGPSTPVSTIPSGKVELPINALSEQEAREIVKEGEGSNLDVTKHQDAIYFAPSILGLAILKLKGIKRRLLGQVD